MQYTIMIDQVGVARAGLADKTDLVDWALIDYLIGWQGVKEACILYGDDGNPYIWCNYEYLIAQMPLLGITTKSGLTARLAKLSNLELVKTITDKQRTYVFVTPTAYACRHYRERPAEPTPDTPQPFTPVNGNAQTVHGGERTRVPSSGLVESQPKEKEIGVPISLPTPERGQGQPELTHGAIFTALLKVCRYNGGAMTAQVRGRLNRAAKDLRKAGATPLLLDDFEGWWYANDWRGRQKQPPTPDNVAQSWPVFAAAPEHERAGMAQPLRDVTVYG